LNYSKGRGGYHPCIFSTSFCSLQMFRKYFHTPHFYIFLCTNFKMPKLMLPPREYKYQHVKRVGVDTAASISQLLNEIETKFQRFPMLSGSSCLMRITGMLNYQTRSLKSYTATSKTEYSYLILQI